jgi:hypothetical protein
VASGPVKGDGTFRVLNAPVGEVVALVETESARFDPAAMAELARSKGAAVDKPAASAGPPLKFVPINKKYNDPARSPLKFAVTKGANSKDLDLE